MEPPPSKVYRDIKNNITKPEMAPRNRIRPPSKAHFSETPPGSGEDQLKQLGVGVTESEDILAVPIKVLSLECMPVILLEFNYISEAMEGLLIRSHIFIYKVCLHEEDISPTR